MHNFIVESEQKILNKNFKQFCLHHKILLKEDKYGAFEVPDITTLRKCITFYDTEKIVIKDEFRNLLRSMPRFCSEHYANYLPRSYKRCKTMKRKKKQSCKRITCDSFLNKLKLKIFLHNTSPVLMRFERYRRSLKCILNIAISGDKIFHFIMERNIKSIKVTNHEASIPVISSLLEQFQKKHKNYKYLNSLHHIIMKQQFNEVLKCKYEISIKKLKLFFNRILDNVVPSDMFGGLRNLKRIKNTIFQLLKAPCFKRFSLKPLIKKLNITRITWLQDIKSTLTKWIITVKFITWFFKGFIFQILYTYFHMTGFGRSKKRIYILYSNWKLIQKKFISKSIYSGILQPDIQNCATKSSSIGVYKLYIKNLNLRPIFKSKDSKDLPITHTFLTQLYFTKYGNTDFKKKWKSIIQTNSEAKKLYIVSCDVMDAFGSINQGLLYHILTLLCKNLPEALLYRYYVVKSRRCTDICYKQYFSTPNLLLPFRSGTLYTYTSDRHSMWINKTKLLEIISKHIFHQRVNINGTTYTIGKGIVQGSKLSPILSSIYYDFILHEVLTFSKAGKIIKYMDDILYITEDKTFAEEFLKLTESGIPQFNCYFNQMKTQSNVFHNTHQYVKYIGYKINCTSLEVGIIPSSYRDLKYSMSFFFKKRIPLLKVLNTRLNNVAALKISDIILDPTVNSKVAILETVHKICLIQAQRACILIKELFDNMEENISDIFRIITNSNKRIAKHIITVLLRVKETMTLFDICVWHNEILQFLWKAYKETFLNNNILKKHFIKLFHNIK